MVTSTQRPGRVIIDPDERILNAARRLLYASGEGFTIQQLVDEAGVALQTFYRRYPSKDRLLLAVLDRNIADSCAEMAATTEGVEDPVARLQYYVTRPLRLLQSARSEDAKLVTREHFRLHQVDPAAVARATGAFTALVLEALVDAQERGQLSPGDPERDAWMITELVVTTFHYHAFAGLGPDPDAPINHLWSFCLAAVGGAR